MIIVGDIASPSFIHTEQLRKLFIDQNAIFGRGSLICNLEGLTDDKVAALVNTPVLYNHPSIIDLFAELNVAGVCLANNHTLDLPENIDSTLRLLKDHNIPYAGAGKSKLEAEMPFSYFDKGNEIYVFNFCWEFLLYHQSNPTRGTYVAELDELALLQKVRQLKTEKPHVKIVVNLHWSFDLETLPFPAYRQFSRLLIDAGVTVVCGCHSHCVQGGEAYKDGYIIYGLGNFFIPNNVFANGQLRFPEMSKMQLAFEYDFTSGLATCHWFKYDEATPCLITHFGSDDFHESHLLPSFSPYASMNDEAYLQYFKKNRRKKFLVPVYTDVYKRNLNTIFTSWLKLRARVLRTLAKYNLRAWQN